MNNLKTEGFQHAVSFAKQHISKLPIDFIDRETLKMDIGWVCKNPLSKDYTPSRLSEEQAYTLYQLSFASSTAFELLEGISAGLIMDGIELPHSARLFVASVLRGVHKKPKKKLRKNDIRNLNVCILILAVSRKFQINAMRNAASPKNTSACDVVAEALNMTFETVASVWSSRNKKRSAFKRASGYLDAIDYLGIND